MKLSEDIIFYHLSKEYPVKYAVKAETNKEYERPVIYDNGVYMRGYVVIVNSEILLSISKHPEDCACSLFICVDDAPAEIKNTGFPVLTFDTVVSPVAIFNTLQRVFSKFDEWDERLKSIVIEEQSFMELISLCSLVVDAPIALVDNEFHYAAFSELFYEDFIIQNSVGENMSAPLEYASDLFTRKDFQYYIANKTEFLYSFGEVDCDVVCKNIFNNDIFVGSIGILLKESSDFNYYVSILRHLHYYAYRLYIKHKSFGRKKDVSIALLKLIGKRLEGLDVSDVQWSNALNEIGWARGNRFQLLLFEASHRYQNNYNTKHLFEEIMRIWNGIICYDNEDCHFIVVNLDAFSSIDKKDFYQTLSYFLRDNLLIAGLSRVFFDFAHIPSAYIQAKTALVIGQEDIPDLWCHKFDDYALKYIVRWCTGSMEKEMICSEKLLTLKSHDASKNTEYYKTLMTYFQSLFSATKAAKKLFIQRSTFLYRLDKIQELVDIDFKSYNEIRYLFFSFSILEGQ